MHLPTHLALSWLLGHRLEARRDRVLVAWAGVAPDLDALSALAGIEAYGRWHHVVAHGLVAALVISAVVAACSIQRRQAAVAALLAVHLHLVCDLLGSGRAWSVTYLFPFDAHETFSPYGWPLASWQNVTVTVAALAVIGVIGVRRRRTFAEAFLPARAADAVSEALVQRFGPKPPADPRPAPRDTQGAAPELSRPRRG